MRYAIPLAAIAALVLPTTLAAQAAEIEFINAARAGAPAHISDAAAIARMEPNGRVTMVREGTNGFTCFIIPDGSNAPTCADAGGLGMLKAAFSQTPPPPMTAPGIAYMAKGGMHLETPEGEIAMAPSATTKQVSEPPHWMLMWPVSAAASGLPTRPNPGGVYVMFDGTPYAHLMIYQDPKLMK